jgi:hypothetical protein
VRTGRLGMGMGSIGLREVKGVEAPVASGPDLTGVTVPRVSQCNVGGEGAELGASYRGG